MYKNISNLEVNLRKRYSFAEWESSIVEDGSELWQNKKLNFITKENPVSCTLKVTRKRLNDKLFAATMPPNVIN